MMKEAIFDEGKRMTTKEWSKALYGKDDRNKVGCVYSIMKRMLNNGYGVVAYPSDPEDISSPKNLVPLTESVEVSRYANSAQKSRIDGNALKFGVQSMLELEVYPEMGKEIAEMFEDTLKALVGQKKLILAIEEPTYVKKLQSGNGSNR